MLASILSICNKYGKLKEHFKNKDEETLIDNIVSAIKRRFYYLFDISSKKFEKAVIATFLLPQVKLNILESLNQYVNGVDKDYILKKIIERNWRAIRDFLTKESNTVSKTHLKFLNENKVLS